MSKKKEVWLSDEDYKFIFQRVPRICVDLIIKCPFFDGVLLTKRAIKPYKYYWHLPGGGIRMRESIDDAIKRIFQSELGIAMPISCEPKLVGIIEFPRDGEFRHSISLAHEILMNYAGELLSLELCSQSNAVNIFKNLPKKIIPNQRRFLIGNGYLN